MTTKQSVAPLTFWDLLLFWIPLFASWLLMTAEGPIIHAALTRLPDPKASLAAFGIVLSLSVTIESPIIMLLSTTTALADRWSSYLVLRRFTLHINIIITVIAALIAFHEPLFDLIVPGLMGIPENISELTRQGMKVMIFWSAAIGWRRFNQGLLVRFGQSRHITYGTTLRLIVTVTVAFMLGFVIRRPGVEAGSMGLMSGVAVEAIYIWLASRYVKAELLPKLEETKDPLTYGEVVRFHTPLAATSVLSLLSQPLIGAALARMPHSDLSLAAWPVIFGFLLIFRSPTFAIPELVIALSKNLGSEALIRRFSLGIGLLTSSIMGFLLITPLLHWVLINWTGLTPRLTEFALIGLIATVTVPFLQAFKNWVRGLLMCAKSTTTIYYGMGLNLLAMALIMAIGVYNSWSGVKTAGWAVAIATLLEALFLWRGAKRIEPKEETSIAT